VNVGSLRRLRLVRAGLTSALALAIFAGCGGAKPSAAVGLEHATAAPHRPPKRVAPRTQRLFTASVTDRLVGPFLARGAGKNLVTWIDSNGDGTRRVRALVTDDLGVSIQPIRELVPSAGDVTSLIVERAGGEDPSFVLAWTTIGSRGETLSVMGAGDDGVARSTPSEVASTNEDIVWVHVVPVRRGAIVLWAEETRDGKANLLSVAVDPHGKPRGVPTYVLRGIVGWQAAPSEDGAVVGALTDASRKKEAAGFVLAMLRLDDDGRPTGGPLAVQSDATVQPDFEMVRAGARGALFAWTDKSGLEPEVKTTIVDDRDRVAPPRGLVSSLSGAKLLLLSPLAQGALLAWEAPSQRPRSSRRVHLERLEAGESVASSVLELDGKGPPEIVAAGDGAAVLGRVRVCDKKDSEEACASAPFSPAVLELDRALLPVRAERIDYDDPPETASLAWGLRCAPATARASAGPPKCLVLALGAPEREAAQPVLAAPTFERATTQHVLVAPLHAPGRPHPRALATVFRSEPVSEIALGRARGASMLAVLTRGAEDASLSRRASKVAALYLVPMDEHGKPGDAAPLAPRASAVGGVSFATAVDGSLVLAWASREEQGARVHLTRVSPAGKKLADVLVTTRHGDVSDVNVAAVEGGFVVAWVDGRDGKGEVYAAKVTADLGRVSEHQRITSAPGDASDLTALAHPSGVVWLAWTDPRESPREGTGDIYVASVRAKDARKASDETRVLATVAHSRSPSLAVAGDGFAIGWIEDAPIGTEAEGHAAYGAMLTWLDARGHGVREPTRLRGAGRGAPVSIVLDPSSAGSRGLLVRSAHEELALDAFTVEAGGRVVSSWLVSPEGPSTLDLPLAPDGDVAVYAEEARSPSEHKVRRMELAWPPR
jgi:hypothetical protein